MDGESSPPDASPRQLHAGKAGKNRECREADTGTRPREPRYALVDM